MAKKSCTRRAMKERNKLIKKIKYSTLGNQTNDISTENRDRAKWPIQKEWCENVTQQASKKYLQVRF